MITATTRASNRWTTKLLAIFALMAGPAGNALELNGAGATFPAPIYTKWAFAYERKSGNSVEYKAVGSSSGITQIERANVDFGGSDVPMKVEELEKKGLVQFPMIIGGAVPVINLRGLKPGELKLTGPLLADIFLGKVKKWNDPVIASLNPGLNLPEAPILVVHRSDGSGTTFIWTNYLSKVSSAWKNRVGEGASVAWPLGQGGIGNDGVAAALLRTPGAIGYLEYSYATRNKLAYASVQNRSGQFITPSIQSFRAAAAAIDWSKQPGFYAVMTDAQASDAWPITGATYILMQKKQTKPANTKELLAFFRWAYSDEGDRLAEEMGYVALPANLVTEIQRLWSSQFVDALGKSISF